jgi:hypothetical protein
MQSLDPPSHVVAEKVARRGHRRRRPRRRCSDGHIGGRVEQRADDRHSRDAVGHCVMHSQIQAYPSFRQAGQQPHLPRRPRHIKPLTTQLWSSWAVAR